MAANNILANGESRFNAGGVTNNISFENQSTIIGENAGQNIVDTAATLRNFYNTFVGYKAGQFSINVFKNIFVGFEAGMNVTSGSNNIIIGRNYDGGNSLRLNNIISLGFDNTTPDRSVSIGTSNNILGFANLGIGINNNMSGQQNIAFGNGNTILSNNDVLVIGNNNQTYSGKGGSIILGNNIIVPDSLSASNSIYIGHNLDCSNYVMNIGNVVYLYDNFSNNQILFLGHKNKYNDQYALHTAVGFKDTDTFTIDYQMQQDASNIASNMWYSLYVKDGIYTDGISLGSYTSNVNYSITLKGNPSIASNIHYTLPLLPDSGSNASNVVLSVDQNGVMYWKPARFDNAIETTDQLTEGIKNKYYKDDEVSNKINIFIEQRFPTLFEQNYAVKLAQLNLDQIKNGTSNKYIQSGFYDQDLTVSGGITTNRIQVLGNDIQPNTNINNYIAHTIGNTSNELVSMIALLLQRIQYLETKVL